MGDLKGLLFTVVAEKTGYPAEMLTLEMGLEADLAARLGLKMDQ